MTSPDGSPDDGEARRPLDRLHQQALAGEVTTEGFLKACYSYILRAVQSRQYPHLRDSDAEDQAGQVLANVLRTVGGQGDKLGLFPGVEKISAYLDRAIRNRLIDEHAKVWGQGKRPPLSFNARISDADGDDLHPEVPDPSAEINVENIAARAAYARARRRAARLRAEATAGRRCPFHMRRPCPHANAVIDFLEKALEYGDLLSYGDIADLLAEKGRTLSLPANRTGAGRRRRAGSPEDEPPQTLSDHEHTLDRHFRRCFEWWWYRALVGTELDPVTERPAGLTPAEPSSAADRLRLPIVDRLRLTKDGDWNRETCSLPGAVELILPDEEFWRLLYVRKRDVYDYLEGRTS